MARPRKYIQDDGKTVDGLSLHKPSRRYYSIGERNQRTDWGRDKAQAIQAYRKSLNPVRPPRTAAEAIEAREIATDTDLTGVAHEDLRQGASGGLHNSIRNRSVACNVAGELK